MPFNVKVEIEIRFELNTGVLSAADPKAKAGVMQANILLKSLFF